MIAGRIVQAHSKMTILPQVRKTQSLFERMKGLLGCKKISEGEGLLIDPCNSVHTFFMKMDIDVVFLNREDIIVKIKSNLKPRRMAMSWKAATVLELGAGQVARSGLKLGDHLGWEKAA